MALPYNLLPRWYPIAVISIGIEDIQVPPAKKPIMETADKDVVNIENLYRQGLITEDQRYQKSIDIWIFPNDYFLSHIDQTTSQITRVRCPKRRIRQTFSSDQKASKR